ncbi:MAG: hypothetical protein VYE73_15955 [Acidobacteriota bacterium]|nr:hypothetical protein [Acidobacteriota bacterium]
MDSRRKALEEAFFAKQNKELLERLRQKAAEEDRRAGLVEVLGSGHERLVDDLVELEVSAETIAALGLVPLVVVAWADGKVQAEERSALAEAARSSGVEAGSVAWELFEGWLDAEPDDSLFEVWKEYVGALRENWSADSVAALEAQVVGRAESVARAAGGILGVGSVYGSERGALKEIRAAFRG